MATILIGNWWALALRGVVAILFALIAFIKPGIAAEVVILLFGAYALLDGIFALVAAGMAMIRLSGEWLLVVGGALSILLGLILFVQPAVGVVALSWWLGIYALLFGIMLLSVAFRIRYHPI